MLLQIIGAVLFIVILYLAIVIFTPVLRVPEQPIKRASCKLVEVPSREDVSFSVNGSKVSAWFYKNNKSAQSPCIVMSHGFSGTKDMGLQKYALKYLENGYSVLTYDYRYYGDSEGEPRQLYCAKYQIEDLREAVKFVRSRQDVDSNKIVLWGSSAGANYGTIIAAEDESIAAVIAQCGSFDHKEDMSRAFKEIGMFHYLKLFVHAQRDKGRSRFGLSPHVYPAYGHIGTTAMINGAGAFEGIEKLAEESITFKNETCARLAFMPHDKDPLKVGYKIKCPVQIIVCQNDNLISPKSHVKLVDILKEKAFVLEYPIGHFDVYFGKYFDIITDNQIEFIEKVINP